MGWLAVADGYEVTLQDGELVCRNAAGRTLRSVPKVVREAPAAEGLLQLTEWLGRHETECRAAVERWMLRSLPVPTRLLTEVWPDEAWADALRNLVVTTPDGGRAGFLRDVGENDLGLVDLDGETIRLETEQVLIPHPVLLHEVDALREFAADLDFGQSIDQLFREIRRRPADLDPTDIAVSEYAGGRYDQLRQLTGRAARAGFRVRGGFAACRVVENGEAVEAQLWVGADDPYAAVETGNLYFSGDGGRTMTLGEVGPVAWSEGTRMAAILYAGRVVTGERAA